MPEWECGAEGADTVKLEPQWFKTKFWNNKQEKKNPVHCARNVLVYGVQECEQAGFGHL